MPIIQHETNPPFGRNEKLRKPRPEIVVAVDEHSLDALAAFRLQTCGRCFRNNVTRNTSCAYFSIFNPGVGTWRDHDWTPVI
ncbi:MAG: hypothetical protein JW395_2888 [Nitrospira sp.]|nr:hypothetical protein [Nitrospira sp.]